MAIYKEDIVDIELTGGNIYRSFCNRSIGEGDALANRFGVRVYRDGQPVQLTGSCVGLFIRADGGTVTVEGVLSANIAYVELPQACYAVEGQYSLAIKVVSGSATGTMRIVDGVVSNTSTDTVIDPGTIIPSIEALIAAIDAAIERIPADYSVLQNTVSGLTMYSDATTLSLFPKMTKDEIIKNVISDGRILEGTTTPDKAWRRNGTETSGSVAYMHTRYSGASLTGQAGAFLIVSGYSWAYNWPLICFYDSSDNLICCYGSQTSATAHVYDIVPVPFGVSYCEVNGKTSTNPPEVATISATVMQRMLSNRLMPFYSTINDTFLTNYPNYADVINLPDNTIYNIASSAIGLMTNLPELTSGQNNATLIKFNGGFNPSSTGWTMYLLRDNVHIWTGWHNGASIRWINSTPTSNIIGVGLEYIDSTSVTEGKAKHINGTEESGSSYIYSTFAVTGSSSVLISGKHYANAYPLWIFYDSNGNVISSAKYGNTGIPVYQKEVSIPENATTLIVNGQRSKAYAYINPSVEKVTTDVTLNNFYQEYKKRRYLFIGDSYCEGYSHDGNNSGWAVYCAEYMQLDSSDYVRKYKGGARFSANGSNNTYEALLDAVQYPFDYFTDIVVCGGYNDHAYTEQNVLDGIASFIALAKAKYPIARIHIGFVAWNKAGNGSGAEPNWETYNAQLTGTTLPAYQKCSTLGVGYLNNVEYWLNNAGLTPSDGYHPSETGNRNIARAVANALLTGSAQMPYNASLRLT